MVVTGKQVHPLVRSFFNMVPITKHCELDDNGVLTVVEVRGEPGTGERQRLTYTLEPRRGSTVKTTEAGQHRKGVTP